MFTDLDRCGRCHKPYLAPFGHRCAYGLSVDPRRDIELSFRSWLETSDGRFAEYLARRQRDG
jgi:hypothetical protein